MQTFKQFTLSEKKQDVALLAAKIRAGNFSNSIQLTKYVRESESLKANWLGEGFFSVVYASGTDPEFIMKVPRSSGSRKGDIYPDAWTDFAKIAKQAADKNPLYPKIEFFHEFGNNDFVAFIEVLNMVPESKLDNESGTIYTRTVDKSTYRFKDPMFSDVMSGVRDFFMKSSSEFELLANEFMKLFGISAVHLDEFFNSIAKLGKLDLHAANVGFRKNGQIVLFDPVA